MECVVLIPWCNIGSAHRVGPGGRALGQGDGFTKTEVGVRESILLVQTAREAALFWDPQLGRRPPGLEGTASVWVGELHGVALGSAPGM